MSVTSHLKDLLTKMGGTPKDGDSTSVLIDKIEDVYDSGSGGGGGSGTDSNVLIVNATWLLASNDPLREQYEAQVHERNPDAVYHGRFVLDKTWNEVKNAQSAVIRFESNETDVTMGGDRVFSNYPMSITMQINVSYANTGEIPILSPGEISHAYLARCVSSSNDYLAFLPHYDGTPFDQVYFKWGADNENDYLSSGPLIEYPSV